MQYYFYFDQTLCIGCNTCRVACKDYNGIGPGPVAWRTVSTLESGSGTALKIYNMSLSCHHCEDPACVTACPSNSIYKDEETGIVVLDRLTCGNRLDCVPACPYSAIQPADERQQIMFNGQRWHTASKCDMCRERLAEDKKPVCVDACIMRALDMGTKAYLEGKYGAGNLNATATGFTRESTNPAIYFKAK